MTARTRAGAAALDGDRLGLTLLEQFKAQGYDPIEPAMLLPADTVLDHMGEDIRRRLLLTLDPSGKELCLRPDFTLPVALEHIRRGGGAARYGYAGVAFRFPTSTDPLRVSAEFRQAGIEDYGAADARAADAGMVGAALSAIRSVTDRPMRLSLGDVSVFGAVVGALNLSPAWAQRLHRLFWRHSETGGIAETVRNGDPGGARNTLSAELVHMDPDTARGIVEEVMGIAGVAAVGGRSARDIAGRYVERARTAQEGPLSDAVIDALDACLTIDTPPREAVEALRDLASRHALDITATIDGLESRLGSLESLGIDLGDARFAAAFGRRIEYYTGFVFELRAAGSETVGAIAGGGRYDRFLSDLGAGRAIPAVGCSIYVDRLSAVAGAAE